MKIRLYDIIFDAAQKVPPTMTYKYNSSTRQTDRVPEHLYYSEYEDLEEEEKQLLIEFMHYQNGKDLIDFLVEKGYKKIGEGQGRAVFEFNQYYVLKVSKTSNSQNKKEIDIELNDDVNSITPTLIAADMLKNVWLLVEKVNHIFSSDEEFEAAAGISLMEIEEIIAEARQTRDLEEAICNLHGQDTVVNNEYDPDEDEEYEEEVKKVCNPEILKHYMSNDVLTGLDALTSTYDLGLGDLLRHEHWGQIGGYKIVLIDPGWNPMDSFRDKG